MSLSLDPFPNVPGVDQPDKGHKEGNEKEEKTFLFDKTKLLVVDVPVFNSFN
ncbi:MAG: hypothetical protein KDD45_14555 [Bdellovibrionales bacterium]|nr:hypothetical protein [Bdellovibrionales bacterium]